MNHEITNIEKKRETHIKDNRHASHLSISPLIGAQL